MKFTVTRTSDWKHSDPPCQGAVAVGTKSIFGEPDWTIDLPDLDALADLIRREGQIVIEPPERAIGDHPAGEFFQLEIYDYYRE